MSGTSRTADGSTTERALRFPPDQGDEHQSAVFYEHAAVLPAVHHAPLALPEHRHQPEVPEGRAHGLRTAHGCLQHPQMGDLRRQPVLSVRQYVARQEPDDLVGRELQLQRLQEGRCGKS